MRLPSPFVRLLEPARSRTVECDRRALPSRKTREQARGYTRERVCPVPSSPTVRTVILLTISNVFMTLAWYGHLTSQRFKTAPLWIVVIASWGIALLEYCF